MLDNLIGVHDDRDEEGEHHVDEEGAEEVEVHLAVHPHRPGLEIQKTIVQVIKPVFRIRISLSADPDPDPGFYLNADPDSGFYP